MGDITEKLITLTSEKGTVYEGVRTEQNGKYSETWKKSSQEIKGAYVSLNRVKGLKIACKSYAISEDNTSTKFKEKLEGLLQTEIEQHFEGDEGYFVILIKQGDLYNLSSRAVKADIKNNKNIESQTKNEYEEDDIVYEAIGNAEKNKKK
jgi:hypothetical protein